MNRQQKRAMIRANIKASNSYNIKRRTALVVIPVK